MNWVMKDIELIGWSGRREKGENCVKTEKSGSRGCYRDVLKHRKSTTTLGVLRWLEK
ncbi:hypothetical protein BgiMline_012649, partial [Biomphalaria glabrata]